ncbi:hypothetical protein [Streptomyces erythrochromogenes]|uniref:hypothetical protein n=1 Tax=Streptomyces erythrochromogenes TaxID=285574 RepID=UPI0036F76C9F
MLPLIHLHPGARVFHQDTGYPALPAPVTDDERVTEIDALTDRLAPCGDCRHLAFTSPGSCDGYAPHSREEAEGPMSLTLCGTCALRATL